MFLDLKAKDGENDRFYAMASGLWPRFSSYEIREKDGRHFICPEENAKLEKYDPWATQNNKFNLSRSHSTGSPNRETRPSYIHFLSFFDELGIDLKKNSGVAKLEKLTDHQKRVLCEWCGRYGLLGILFHEVKMFRLPYVERQPEGNLYKSIAFNKKQGKWLANDFHFQGNQLHSQKAVASSFQDWQKGRVELESSSSSSLFADQADTFYWSDPYWIAANYFPFSKDIITTLTTSDDFEDVWRGYCEPIDFFWDKIVMLAKGLMFLGHRQRKDLYEQGVGALNMLLGEAPVSYALVHGKVVPKLRTPSLLSAYSLMALDDAANGASLFQCENEKCHSWFISRRINAKFCTSACNTAEQQRKHRQRKKEVGNAFREGGRFCKGCGASMTGKRPQAKFCTTTCGNTFRKREQRARLAKKVI